LTCRWYYRTCDRKEVVRAPQLNTTADARLCHVPAKRSAGILLFRQVEAGVEVLLGHMGGPFWARKDAGAWTMPKGEYGPDEEPMAAARREFTEELGLPVPPGDLLELGTEHQSGGKTVTAWALSANLDPASVVPGTFEMEWPPKSGKKQEFPELDRVAWLPLTEATEKIVKGQRPFLDRLAALLG
jgi:predicted NUDIX family NTP pyrophosphohydrolase